MSPPPPLPPGAAAATHRVCIGEFQVAAAPDRLAIHGLGSCVAVLLHDPGAAISGLAHILLPSPPSPDAPGIPGRYASTAIPALLEALRARGGHPRRLIAKVAGGAQMFQYERIPQEEAVGARNLRAALAALERAGLPVAARDTGGSHGRTLIVDAASGRIEVRAVLVEPKLL